MRPENDIKDDLDRTVDGWTYLTIQEKNFLTLYRELSGLDRVYLLRVAGILSMVKDESGGGRISNYVDSERKALFAQGLTEAARSNSGG